MLVSAWHPAQDDDKLACANALVANTIEKAVARRVTAANRVSLRALAQRTSIFMCKTSVDSMPLPRRTVVSDTSWRAGMIGFIRTAYATGAVPAAEAPAVRPQWTVPAIAVPLPG